MLTAIRSTNLGVLPLYRDNTEFSDTETGVGSKTAEERMTILVGLVGVDGIVLAADRLISEPPSQENHLYNQINSSKIVDRPDLGIAYAYAGDECAKTAGEFVAASANTATCVRQHDVRTWLEKAGNDAFERECVRLPGFNRKANRRTLVVLYGSRTRRPQLWELTVREIGARAVAVESVVAGASGNPARFFYQYFARGSRVELLSRLAAHIVLAAGRIDPFYIEGLDVAVIDDGGMRLHTEEQIASLTRWSESLDNLIEKQFGDTPDVIR